MLTLASIEPELLAIIFAGMGFVLVLMAGIFWYAWHDDKRKRAFKLQMDRETTHREIAAYAAEGSISPDDAERLIRAMGETDEAFARVAGLSGGSESLPRGAGPMRSPRPSVA